MTCKPVVTTTTQPHVTLQQPVVVTSNKVNAGPASSENHSRRSGQEIQWKN